MLLPQFNTKPEEIKEKLTTLLREQRVKLEDFLHRTPTPSFQELVPWMEQMDNEVQQFWSPIAHLHAVASTPALRTAYQESLPLLTDYATWLGQHQGLYHAYHHIRQAAAEFDALSAAEQRIIELRLRDFHLAGVDLPAAKKQRFAEIEQALALCGNQFGEHVLDATQHWHYDITDATRLAGLPEAARLQAQQNAARQQVTGWRLTLDYPCYRAVMQYAEEKDLREHFYHAYSTRASDLDQTQWDNTGVMQQILSLRQELAHLLDYENYAALSLATKMAHTPDEVLNFLQELAHLAKPAAQQAMAELEAFAGHALAPWDIAYYSEKLRQQRYQLDQEALRPYFPLPRVLQTLFDLVQRLFGITVTPLSEATVWHPDVQCYQIQDNAKQIRGIFYADWYVREHKRAGAWMDDYCSRLHLENGDWQIPVAFLTCNFAPPQNGQPALLTHDDVVTLFHEFGHGLHHLLTTVDYLDINGMHHVPWDAVEFPSQWMENWCWQRPLVQELARHYQTGAALPREQLDALLATQHFQAGLQLVRQLEFGLFDFYAHLATPDKNTVTHALQQARAQTAVYPVPDYYRMPHTFSHVFDGGYAAGYYSYLWAEVLAADAFEAFTEGDELNIALGQRFLQTILSQGGAQPPEQLFIAFRGRQPDLQALLRAWGVQKSEGRG